MGHRDSSGLSRGSHRRRAQQATLIHAVMTCLVVLVSFQFLLLGSSTDAMLSGHDDVLAPAALASAVCFLAGGWLIGYVLAREGAGGGY